MSTDDIADDHHFIELYKGTIQLSDYPLALAGSERHIARCSCGWSVVRQLKTATLNQITQHRAKTK